MEKIDFEDIRVGDRIEAHRAYSNGDLSVCRLTVQEKDTHYVASAEFVYTSKTSAEYFLVERPKPTFKVGDTITGEQVADLPDGAVFDLNEWGTDLRYKINGEVYAAQGYITYLDIYREGNYRDIKIVLLPEA